MINVKRYLIIFKNIDKMLKNVKKLSLFCGSLWNERTENNFSLIYSLNMNFSEFFRSFQKNSDYFKEILQVMTQFMSHLMINVA